MHKILILDDEVLAIEELKFLLSGYSDIEISATFTNPMTLIEYLKHHQADLIFLDIEMPKKSGLEIAEMILESYPDTRIIFVTAYDKYAIDAFNINAVDYLLKPTSQERLNQALHKALQMEKPLYQENIKRMLSTIRNKKDFISVYNNGYFVPVRFESVIYIKSEDGTVILHTLDKTYSFPGTLLALEEHIDYPYFFRTHRSFIVNINFIEKIEPTERSFILKMKHYEELIPVARSNSNSFKEIMSIY
ncbi:MAG: hypothetical protein AVO33_05065 [delta proteobacterium ML8_F1]|nr:MAG: hypothetical protein AVO33_05065 [delta proteobacterium ML8_F1]